MVTRNVNRVTCNAICDMGYAMHGEVKRERCNLICDVRYGICDAW